MRQSGRGGRGLSRAHLPSCRTASSCCTASGRSAAIAHLHDRHDGQGVQSAPSGPKHFVQALPQGGPLAVPRRTKTVPDGCVTAGISKACARTNSSAQAIRARGSLACCARSRPANMYITSGSAWSRAARQARGKPFEACCRQQSSWIVLESEVCANDVYCVRFPKKSPRARGARAT